MVYTEQRFRPLLDKWRIDFLIEYATYLQVRKAAGEENNALSGTMFLSNRGLLCAEVNLFLRKCTREANVRCRSFFPPFPSTCLFFSLSYIA